MDMFWEADGWEERDPHLLTLSRAPFRRPFPFIPTRPGLYSIRGPRQVGKSSWLKRILSDKCHQGLSCFYLSCENVRDHLDLAYVLETNRRRHIILLDEITFVKDWARAIKHEADAGHVQTIVFTGSHAADLRRGTDRMPGRWGGGGEFSLLPMNFDEFRAAREEAGWSAPNRLNELVDFFHIGGFPHAVIEAGKSGRPVHAMETFAQWLLGDATRLGKQEVYLREVLGQLALTMGAPISLQKLAQRTQLGSHHTAQSYVELLEDCFALRTLYAVDTDTGALRFRKEKKFYFTDPLIYWLALSWTGNPPSNDKLPQLAEMVACQELAQRYDRVGYLHSPKGEIDFYAKDAWALEVKWSILDHNLSKAFRDIRIPKKLVWNQSNFLIEWP